MGEARFILGVRGQLGHSQAINAERHMKLYTSVGPNPRVVTIYLAEKSITLPSEQIDIVAGENRQDPYISTVNPTGETPALQLDNGHCISESVAICEYLDENDRSGGLIGETAEDRAIARMWLRRVDHYVVQPLTAAFRAIEGRGMFESRVPVVSGAAGEDLKSMVQTRLRWLDASLANGPYLAGERFTLADIVLFCFLEFGRMFGQAFPDDLANLTAWYDRVAARPSAATA